MKRKLIVKEKFSSAHYLENYKGKCEKMHGHTFVVEVIFNVDKLDKSGIAIDFTILKSYLKSILPDHKVLNEVYDFSPSAENLSEHFFNIISKDYAVSEVIVWESENAASSYGS
ncbi:MAG: 6-carboxytetrahydropterin synthase [Candidatus Aminicenantes bacterium]|nr:6-carboxytetrahydropterin synthase [Candidatus Aminicenantes bacterium]